MRFWRLLAYLWRSGGSSDDRGRQARRVPTMDSLNEADLLEGRCVRSTLWTDRDVSGRQRAAEVVHLSSAPGHRQVARTQRQFHRLSVVIVDYLLEHEWYWLLTGYRRRPSGDGRERRGPRGEARRVLTRDGAGPIDESNRTVCVDESPWSIVAAIEQTQPPGSTSTTTE
jgi:hypothetical protein